MAKIKTAPNGAGEPTLEKKHTKSVRKRRFFWIGFAFALPWIIGFCCFKIYPICSAIYYSFTDFNSFRSPNWVRLDNYTNLVQDKYVIKSLKNTAYMVIIGLPISISFAMLMSLVMNIKAKGMPLVRTILYIPAMVPSMASALLFMWLMNSRYGIVNQGLKEVYSIIPQAIKDFLPFSFKPPSWINDPKWTKMTLIIMGCWGCGGTAVIGLAALRGVPTHFYEAAELDGASRWTRFWRITIPLISPTIQFQFIMGIINMFQYFTQAFMFNMFTTTSQVTGGGPSDSLLFYAINLYREAFDYLHMGYACALAMVLFVIVMIVTFVAMKVSNKMVSYDIE